MLHNGLSAGSIPCMFPIPLPNLRRTYKSTTSPWQGNAAMNECPGPVLWRGAGNAAVIPCSRDHLVVTAGTAALASICRPAENTTGAMNSGRPVNSMHSLTKFGPP